MERHKAKRVEITIENVMRSRLTDTLREAGVTGYTILPVFGGAGRSGEWSRSGQVSRAEGMVQVVCIVRPERVDGLLAAAMAVVERHIGVICVTDCEVMRAERF